MSYIQILKFQKEDSQRNNSTCLPELESNINRIREVQQVVSKQKDLHQGAYLETV